MICPVCWHVGGTIGRRIKTPLIKFSQSPHTHGMAHKEKQRETAPSQLEKEREGKRTVSEIIYVFFHRLDFNLGEKVNNWRPDYTR
jgi:hypothetical protein